MGDELMVASGGQRAENFVSAITLALAEDSGWYNLQAGLGSFLRAPCASVPQIAWKQHVPTPLVEGPARDYSYTTTWEQWHRTVAGTTMSGIFCQGQSFLSLPRYKPDYSRATKPIENRHWGYKKGCGFVRDKCVDVALVGMKEVVTTAFPDHFCTDEQDGGCTTSADGRELAYCDISVFSKLLAEPFRYFPNAKAGGTSVLMDRCPRRRPYLNGDCRTIKNGESSASKKLRLFNGGSARSQCFRSRVYLTDTGALGTSAQTVPACFRVECEQPGSRSSSYYNVYGRDGTSQEMMLGRCDFWQGGTEWQLFYQRNNSVEEHIGKTVSYLSRRGHQSWCSISASSVDLLESAM